MPVIALTGATGFIGRATLARLLASSNPARIRALVRDPDRLTVDHPKLEHVVGDLADRAALQRLVDGADAVVHLAGAIAGSRQRDFERANLDGTALLADAIADRAPGAHALLVSSLAATRPELSWYTASKAGAERAWRERLPGSSTVLRPPAVYGPDDPALADFWRMLARGWLIRLGPATARFSLVHVDDVGAAIERLLYRGPSTAPFALAGPQPDGGWTWSEVARLAATVRGGRIRTLAIPGPALRTAGRLALAANRLRGRAALLSPGKVRELRHVDWVCDNLALSAHLDWRPHRRLDEALESLPGWTRA
ncbi:NAD(P)H-binding protein [Wenzhouxiangella sp. XN79A]|uniref:NAD-dependent epimerase/dehydratase family protein n=1 Tax=Wenzhouxiangella sp. XN79A TaxID=2724193 RepID=UPI00144AA4F7|nr:NAD-dependent epimerase/dehydratase family protein [Wenzhouxiangella sp. XN79A]NKI36001.1 NAD(P)H-binding protein [Wenzhouxiangella sp. XN79A]